MRRIRPTKLCVDLVHAQINGTLDLYGQWKITGNSPPSRRWHHSSKVSLTAGSSRSPVEWFLLSGNVLEKKQHGMYLFFSNCWESIASSPMEEASTEAASLRYSLLSTLEPWGEKQPGRSLKQIACSHSRNKWKDFCRTLRPTGCGQFRQTLGINYVTQEG